MDEQPTEVNVESFKPAKLEQRSTYIYILDTVFAKILNNFHVFWHECPFSYADESMYV